MLLGWLLSCAVLLSCVFWEWKFLQRSCQANVRIASSASAFPTIRGLVEVLIQFVVVVFVRQAAEDMESRRAQAESQVVFISRAVCFTTCSFAGKGAHPRSRIKFVRSREPIHRKGFGSCCRALPGAMFLTHTFLSQVVRLICVRSRQNGRDVPAMRLGPL